MADADATPGDEVAHEIAVRLLRGKVHRRRRAGLAAADLAQIERLAEPATCDADEQDRLALGREADAGGGGDVGDHPDRADRGRRQDAAAGALVVERDVAGDDREVERATGFADALHAADELPHHLGLFRIAEVEVVGHRARQGARGGDVAPGLGYRLLAALYGIGLAIALRHVGGQRETLGAIADAHDRGVAAGPADAVAEDEVVVLLPHPAF